jgi:hypothetical protein
LKNGDVDDLMSLLKPTCMNDILMLFMKQSEDCMRSFFFYNAETDQRYTILEVDNSRTSKMKKLFVVALAYGVLKSSSLNKKIGKPDVK